MSTVNSIGALVHKHSSSKRGGQMVKLKCLVFSLVARALRSMWSGFVLMKLWNWFVVPLFNFPSFTFVSATGLIILLEMMVTQRNMKVEDFEIEAAVVLDALLDSLSNSIASLLPFLILGYLFSHFMWE